MAAGAADPDRRPASPSVTVRPIFILSAPRSGSTLLQRVLASHPSVSTASEPWLLLPLLAPLVDGLPAPSGRERLVSIALADLIEELPERADDYRAAVRAMALELYAKLTPPPATHFVDKTPMYHLIVDELFRTFPEGLFVFLFRNPLSVLASSVELLDAGRWEVSRYHMTLFRSFADLAPACERHADRSIVVRYEDLVAGDERPWQRLFEHLELPWRPEVLSGFHRVRLRGRLGDPIGSARYRSLSAGSVDRWRDAVCNPLRRTWCARYLRWLGRDRLAAMGYDLDALCAQLRACGHSADHLFDDARRTAASLLRELVKARMPINSSRASTWRALLGPPATRAQQRRSRPGEVDLGQVRRPG